MAFGKITLQKMILLLRRIVQDQGNPWKMEQERTKASKETKAHGNKSNWPPDKEEEYASIRLHSAVALLRIIGYCTENPSDTNRKALREGSPKSPESHFLREIQRWIEMSYVALDPDPLIREEFVDKVRKYILTKGSNHFRYGAFLVLANGVSEGKKKNKSYKTLKNLIQINQRRCEQEIRKGVKVSFSAPENILPYVIFLLAHHPNLPRNETGAHELISTPSGQKIFVKPFMVLFESLSTVAKLVQNKESNAGLLYTLLDKMWTATDKFDPECKNVHMLGELARMLIKSRLKVSPESIAYPGEVRLPSIYTFQTNLYEYSTPGRNNSSNGKGGDNISLPPISPIVSSSIKKSGKTKGSNTIRTPTWKEPGNSCLPPGFTLFGNADFNLGSAKRKGRKSLSKTRSKSLSAKKQKI
eukprot:CAMPEP_0204825846 /NCGR_PEP_ID=MMETSP1346-20131115/3645_1 /ASSEMBLY_ACC=CAM_ASM_000771 /TAXON_ID=215587 /ORGANISM="Aplanochytrium stocchinoi, Strain GSBS06" /LENGTH=414 /DNA_ID=CAMNT_0051953611 /DNA_START=134 /DNA_END=1378 /DNA_ORIENTATION=+